MFSRLASALFDVYLDKKKHRVRVKFLFVLPKRCITRERELFPGKYYGIVNFVGVDGGNVASLVKALYLSTPLATLVDFPLARTHHSSRSAEVS